MKGFSKGEFTQAVKIGIRALKVDQAAMSKELKAAAETTPNPSRPSRRGPHLAVSSRVKDNDPVRLPQIVAANNDRVARFESHTRA